MCAPKIRLGLLSACMLCIRLTMPDAMAVIAPVSESFELYADGYLIANDPEWSGASIGAGEVSTDAGAISALTTYTNDGGVFPLPSATHDQVLAVTDSLTNTVSSASGGVVITEWLVMPTLRDAADSPGDDNYQVAFYMNSDTNIVIWRRDLAPETNAWLELANTPTIDLAKWMRVRLTLDYATDRYQLAIDGSAISDPEGEQRDEAPSGTWFHMVQTNSAMARFRADAGELTYIDDLVFTNRSVSYSGTTFTEPAANDGSIATTQTITLVNDTFVNPLSPSHVSAVGVPTGLNVSLTRIDATTAELTFGSSVNAPHTADESVAFAFLDSAFSLGSAASVVGYTNALTLDFHDGLGLDWPTTTFTEATANNGTIGNEITLTLVGDTFVNDGAFNSGDEYTISAGSVPGDLGLSITYLNSTQVKLALTNAATSHDGGSGGFTLAFSNAAFTGGVAGNVPNASQALTVTFLAQPVLTYSGTAFAEASNNNGVIGNTQTATLEGTTLAKNGTLTTPTDYTISGPVPGSLSVRITSDGVDELTIGFDSAAPAHTASDGGSFGISFADALFANVAVANITGSSETFSVTFDNQPTISYSGTVFSELAGGVIDNTSPIEITLSGDAFSGANNSDFVAAGKVTTNNVPPGLTLTLTKSSNTKLLARLTGTATANAPGDDVTTMEITFKDSAFTANAAQVAGYSTNSLQVVFNDSVLLINTVPYQESFEDYANGYQMPMTLGWQSLGAGTVTQEAAIVDALNSDFSQFPIDTTHTKVLRVTDEITDEIKSSPGGQLYTDVMLYVTAKDAEPAGSADYQVAFYVNSSEKLVLWHDDGGGAWLETATTVTTGAWHRFTVKQDQTNKRYQLYLDGVNAAVSDAAGYADRTGETTSGSWFKMVDKSGFMSRIRVQGADDDVPAYMDDLVVVQETPEYLTGSLFMFR
jgi:hypothetical protein